MKEPSEVNSALAVRRETTAARTAVWDVLADGWTYSQWVVGNSRMRAVDAQWPRPGSKIHHTIGVWPLVVNDETEVEVCVPVTELVLLAKGRPFGAPESRCVSATPMTVAARSKWPRCRWAARSR